MVFSLADSLAWLEDLMRRTLFLIIITFSITFYLNGKLLAAGSAFEYPYYLIDSYNPDNDCWVGMAANGQWPVKVDPEKWLTGSPPTADVSGVTIPMDHWVELKFSGEIVDGWSNDIILTELDAVGEQALVFITDGSGQEYLLGLAAVPSSGHGPTRVGFDISGISLPFEPRSLRIVGIDFKGGSPGFDLSSVTARVSSSCGRIAGNPIPFDGDNDVPVNAVLSWSPGCSAQKHVVYFGPDIEDVDTGASPVGMPAQPQDANSFNPGVLKLDKTYYWRVDELDGTNDDDPCTGDIWKFTTADYFVVEDFEYYRMADMSLVWTHSGYGYIGISDSSSAASKCQRSLNFYYAASGNIYSEATRHFDPPQDWISFDARSLEMSFYGQAGNYTDTQMYVTLGDGDVNSVVPYPGDANDIGEQEWHTWRIDLEEFADIDLSRVEHFTIGFGNGISPPPVGHGYGTVYFDDIKLYPLRCLEENIPNADFNKDCAVDIEDLDEMTSNWLERGYHVYSVKAPNEPVAWYKFDNNLNDSIGNAHGQFIGNPVYTQGVYGQAISFDGYGNSVGITNAASLFAKVKDAITISFWQKGTASTHHTDTLCCSNFIYGVYNPTIAINLGCWKSPGKYNWDCGSRWSFESRLSGPHRYESEWSGRWNHWAFTKDAQTGRMEIYLNGALYDSRIGVASQIAGIISFEIGAGWYGGYDGLIDDFRIYDYPLSQPEIVYAATNGTGVFDQRLFSPADLNGDNTINFRDFVVLAENWLKMRLYP